MSGADKEADGPDDQDGNSNDNPPEAPGADPMSAYWRRRPPTKAYRYLHDSSDADRDKVPRARCASSVAMSTYTESGDDGVDGGGRRWNR